MLVKFHDINLELIDNLRPETETYICRVTEVRRYASTTTTVITRQKI